jgi:hypothetical protein
MCSLIVHFLHACPVCGKASRSFDKTVPCYEGPTPPLGWACFGYVRLSSRRPIVIRWTDPRFCMECSYQARMVIARAYPNK